MRYVYREGEPECALILQGCSVPIDKMIRVNGVLTDPNATSVVEVKVDKYPKDVTPLLDVPVKELVLFDTRALNCLLRNEITTLRALLEYSADDLKTLPRFGNVAVATIVEKLATLDLTLSKVDKLPKPPSKSYTKVKRTLSEVLGN